MTRPSLSVRVLPIRDCVPAGITGPFTELRFAEYGPVTYREEPTAAGVFIDGRAESGIYRAVRTRLCQAALAERDSRDLISVIAAEFDDDLQPPRTGDRPSLLNGGRPARSGIVGNVQTQALAPDRARPVALVVAGGCWLVAALLAAHYAGTRTAGTLDGALMAWLRGLIGRPGPVAEILVAPTTPALVYAVVGLALFVALLRRRWEVAALAVLGPGIAVLLTELVFKPLVDRTYAGYLSYPSGHTVSSVAAYLVLLLALTAGWRPARRLVALAALLVLTVTLAAGLVGMDYHYPTDTLGGALVTVGVILPCAVLADAVAARRALSARPARPATAPPAGTPRGGTSSGIPR